MSCCACDVYYYSLCIYVNTHTQTQGLLCNSSLRQLNLSHCAVRCATPLAQAIASHPTLLHLNLAWNLLKEQQAVQRAAVVECNTLCPLLCPFICYVPCELRYVYSVCFVTVCFLWELVCCYVLPYILLSLQHYSMQALLAAALGKSLNLCTVELQFNSFGTQVCMPVSYCPHMCFCVMSLSTILCAFGSIVFVLLKQTYF